MWAQVKITARRYCTILQLNINLSVVACRGAGHEAKAYLINLAGHPGSIPCGNISDQYKPPGSHLSNYRTTYVITQFEVGQETAEDLEALTT
jgi:hypothetical protein